MTEKRFLKKHVMITGGGRGIGFEIARQFGREGAVLSIFEYKGDLLDNACEELRAEGYTAYPYLVDVSRRQEVLDAVDSCEKIAPIHTLINNAGIAFETPFLNIDEDDVQWVVEGWGDPDAEALEILHELQRNGDDRIV